MNYLLAVLTHGAHDTLTATLDSFFKHVSPPPSRIVVHADGIRARVRIASMRFEKPEDWEFSTGHQPAEDGFCAATKMLWTAAVLDTAYTKTTHVFWLEHDFVFTRDVDLEALARVMAGQAAFAKRPLAQMALMRDAVNAEEKAAGGLYESRRSDYRPIGKHWTDEALWLEHAAYFTTNPSLMTAEFMRTHPWPPYSEQCEGRFGIDLVEAGYRFGVWGGGEPWVRHIGERSGHGY